MPQKLTGPSEGNRLESEPIQSNGTQEAHKTEHSRTDKGYEHG
jgi:hypothetical protein